MNAWDLEFQCYFIFCKKNVQLKFYRTQWLFIKLCLTNTMPVVKLRRHFCRTDKWLCDPVKLAAFRALWLSNWPTIKCPLLKMTTIIRTPENMQIKLRKKSAQIKININDLVGAVVFLKMRDYIGQGLHWDKRHNQQCMLLVGLGSFSAKDSRARSLFLFLSPSPFLSFAHIQLMTHDGIRRVFCELAKKCDITHQFFACCARFSSSIWKQAIGQYFNKNDNWTALVIVFVFIFGASAKWLTCGIVQGNIYSH